MQRTLLRGRTAELRTILDTLRESASGRGTVVVVEGEAGIGKTALLEAAVERARDLGFTVCVGKAEELDQISPMAPLLFALRGSTPPVLSGDDFAALGPLFDQRLWLVERLAARLDEHSQQRPLLIAVDDLQWADPLTLFALRLLPSRLTTSPILWLVTVRPDSSAAITELTTALRRDVPLRHLALRPLHPEAIHELTVDRLGREPGPRLRQLLQGTAGNPFLASELLDGLLGEEMVDGGEVAPDGSGVPVRLRAVLRGQQSGPWKRAWRLLQVGSVLGSAFTVDDAAALLREPVTDLLPSLDEAVRTGLLVDSGDHVSFRHDLIREAAYEDLPPSSRRILHRAAAERLLETGRPPVEAAPHLLTGATAGDRAAAVTLRQAATEVLPRTPVAAVSLITRAYNLLPPSDPQRLETGEEVVDVFIRARRVRDAVYTADELMRASPDDETVARIQARLARPLWDLGLDDELLARVDQTLERPDLSRSVQARLLAQRALALARGDDPEAAMDAGHAALANARDAGERDAEALALRALAYAADTDGRYAVALEHFQQLRALLGGPAEAGELVALAQLGRYDEARSGFAESRREAEENGTWEVPAFAWWEAATDLALGRLDRAEVGAQTIVRLAEDLQEYDYRVQAHTLLATVALLRGDLGQAGRCLAEARRWTRSEVRLARAERTLTEAFFLHLSGNPADAAELLRAATDSPAALSRHSIGIEYAGLPSIVLIAQHASDRILAERAADLAAVYADRNPGVNAIAGVAAHTRGLVENDVRLLEEAVDLLQGSQRLLSRAAAIEDHGRLLLAAGEREAGIAQLDRAWDTYVAVGATGSARRVQRSLQAAGARRRRWLAATPRPTRGWASLTETERRVALLIAEGRTNRAAAEELYLSPNTIGTHLRSIFAKLGVNSRVQLTRVVLDRTGRDDPATAATSVPADQARFT